MPRNKANRHTLRQSIPQCTVVLAVVTAISYWTLSSTWHALPVTYPLQNHEQLPAIAGRAVAAAGSAQVDDQLLQEVIMSCMSQEDTWIITAPAADKQQHVLQYSGSRADQHLLAVQQCPLLLIPLAAGDRSIGLCTDAAIYVNLLSAWIAPADPATDLQQQQQQQQHLLPPWDQVPGQCHGRSAVMFLEPLYQPWLDWLNRNQQVMAILAPNFEHVFKYDREAHMRMQLVLCKVHRCEELMQQYLRDIGSNASIMFTGHTSVDPTVELQQAPAPTHTPGLAMTAPRQTAAAASLTSSAPPSRQAGRQAPKQGGTGGPEVPGPPALLVAATAQPLRAIHVRGKSSLKHTKQLLDCWLQHPDWPILTVVGPMPNEQISSSEAKRYMAAANVRVPRPGQPNGPGWPLFDPVAAPALAALMASHALHIMPSEREGFGHTINEGRAVGALLVVPDHPPMNELVRDGSGVLISPDRAFSHEDSPVPALGVYGNISVSLSAQGICAAVQKALAFNQTEVDGMGRLARQLFEADRKQFEQKMRELMLQLQEMIAASAAAAAHD